MECYMTCALSKGVLSKSDIEILNRYSEEELSMVACRDTGYFVKLVAEQEEVMQSDHHLANLTEGTKAILLNAVKLGFQCIEFDRDAEDIELPSTAPFLIEINNSEYEALLEPGKGNSVIAYGWSSSTFSFAEVIANLAGTAVGLRFSSNETDFKNRCFEIPSLIKAEK